ncbi:MAG: antibiotic biosynthesis monooxygenase [Pseudomonadota bacterium]
MLAVIFEVEPKDGRHADYFDMAADLKPLLQTIDGFISVERFESLMNPGKILSVSFWRDEEAIKDWRNLTKHRGAQKAGRGDMFADYRIRVAEVVRDYDMHTHRAEVPADSVEHHDAPVKI